MSQAKTTFGTVGTLFGGQRGVPTEPKTAAKRVPTVPMLEDLCSQALNLDGRDRGLGAVPVHEDQIQSLSYSRRIPALV